MPVDVAALVGVGEEGDGARDVFGPGEAGHRGATLYVGVGVAANVLANVCGLQVGAQVLAILAAIPQGQDVTCTGDASGQEVTVSQIT